MKIFAAVFALLLSASFSQAQTDVFSINQGTEVFALPGTVTVTPDSGDNFLWLYDVPVEVRDEYPCGTTVECIGYQQLSFSLFFLPVADDSPDLLNFGMFTNQNLMPGTLGFVFPADPFTLSGDQMTFIPGAYDPESDGLSGVDIVDPPAAPAPTPEPSSLWLFATGLAVFAIGWRFRKVFQQ
jgi:PEP-CTERM motif